MALSLGTITGTLSLEDDFSTQLNATIKSTLAGMGALGSAVTGALAAFDMAGKAVGAFTDAVSASIDAVTDLAAKAERLQNRSLTTGMTTDAIQALDRLAENAGASGEAVTMAISRMQRSIAGSGDAIRKLGLDQREFLGMGTQEQLQALAEKFMQIENVTQRNAAMASILGRGYQQLVPIFKDLAEGNEAFRLSLSKVEIANLAELDDAADDLGNAWDDMTQKLLAAVAAAPEVVQALRAIADLVIELTPMVQFLASTITQAISMFASYAKEQLKVITDAVSNIRDMVEIFGELELSMPEVKNISGLSDVVSAAVPKIDFEDPLKAMKQMEIEQEKLFKKLKEQEKAVQDAAKAWDDYQKDLDKAFESITKNLATNHLEWMETLRQIEEDIMNVGAVLDDLPSREGLDKGIGSEFGGANIPMENAQKMLEQGFSGDAIRKKLISSMMIDEAGADMILRTLKVKMPGVADSFKDRLLSPNFISGLSEFAAMAFGGSAGDMIGGMAQAIGNYGDQMDAAANDADKFAAKVQLGATAAGLLGDVLGKSTNPNVQKLGGALSGAASGAKIGTAIMPGWGTAIGAVAGAITGFVMAGQKMIKMINDQRDAFIEQHGGWEQLQQDIAQFTDKDLLKNIFDADDPKEYAAAVKEVQDLLDTGKAAQENLNAAIERYGFTLEELPMKMRQDEVNAGFAQMLQDFELLKAAGFEVGLVLEKMAPDMSEFVNQAVAAGATVPEAMRPVIEQMIQQGLLLDENGEAYTSVEDAGITFAQTMDEKFTTLIDKITQMVNALLGIPSDVNTNVNVHTNYSSSGEPGGGPRGGADDYYGERNAEGGIVTSPGWSMVAERGPEAIIPLDELSMINRGTGSTTTELSRGAERRIATAVRDAMLQTQ